MPVYIDDKPRYDFQPSMLVCEHWAVIPSSFDSPPKSRISSVLAEELRQTVALVPELDLAWPSISTDPDLHAGCVR